MIRRCLLLSHSFPGLFRTDYGQDRYNPSNVSRAHRSCTEHPLQRCAAIQCSVHRPDKAIQCSECSLSVMRSNESYNLSVVCQSRTVFLQSLSRSQCPRIRVVSLISNASPCSSPSPSHLLVSLPHYHNSLFLSLTIPQALSIPSSIRAKRWPTFPSTLSQKLK